MRRASAYDSNKNHLQKAGLPPAPNTGVGDSIVSSSINSSGSVAASELNYQSVGAGRTVSAAASTCNIMGVPVNPA